MHPLLRRSEGCPATTTALLFAVVTAAAAASADDPCRGDLDGNGRINGADLSRLLSKWGPCTGADCPADLDDDGTVGGSDLATLLGNWGDRSEACEQPPSSERHRPWPIGTRYEDQGFWEYLPAGYGDGTPRPLLVFLHGVGGNGDGDGQLGQSIGNGPPRLIEEDRWPVAGSTAGDDFVVLSPQNSSSPECHDPDDVDEFLRWAIEFYEIDRTRVYLTGLSCGAIGGWRYLENHLEDDLLAATVLICGSGIPTWNRWTCELGPLPVWGFHGDADDVINPIGTIFPLENIRQCADPEAVDARLTIYPGVGHDSWTRTYDLEAGHDVYGWLLEHDNPDAP